MKILLPFLLVLVLNSTTYAHDAAYLIAQKYGLKNWNKVESITYTFNVKSPRAEFGRTWTWHPKEDRVYSHQDEVTYTRGEGMDPKIDQNFINDVFWLLFPFQIVWDPSLNFEEEENVKDPISGATVQKLRVIYNKEDGYTPGDVYELFYDKDYNVTAWNFIRGGEGEGRPTIWKGNENFNGITISTDHRNADGAGLWFSDIEVRLK
ncbi:MAG: hypothetical protein O3C20_22820 [Verrucomicrobia bacterium]|nr:hypothetical protein [Verrucomicrobiota bacterium]